MDEFFKSKVITCEEKLKRKERLTDEEQMHYVIKKGKKPYPKRMYSSALSAYRALNNLYGHIGCYGTHEWYKCPICGTWHLKLKKHGTER